MFEVRITWAFSDTTYRDLARMRISTTMSRVADVEEPGIMLIWFVNDFEAAVTYRQILDSIPGVSATVRERMTGVVDA